MSDEPPFGAFRTSASEERARAIARRLPNGFIGKKAASALLGPAGGRSGRPFDVEVFGGAKARLHPHDNICEKRVYLTPQFWDPKERAALAAAIAARASNDFYFVDVGANVGLYTLFALAETRKRGLALKSLCIEPDAEMRRRLEFNVAASDAARAVRIAPYAVAGADGTLRFSVNASSRGMSRISETGEVEIEARTLARIVKESGFPRIDAMKIDIEGGEREALAPYFADEHAPRPKLIILETSHAEGGRSAAEAVAAAEYEIVLENALNSVFSRRD